VKEIKNGLIIFFTGVFLTLIIIGIVYVKNKFEKVEEVVRTTMFTGIQMPNPNDIKKRLRVQDIVIEDIQGSQNLIVMEKKKKRIWIFSKRRKRYAITVWGITRRI